MEHEALTASGVPGLGALPWGAHCCHFYETGSDLADTLVPYFKTGLEAREACLWVTCAPLSADDARNALRAHVPNLAERERAGQIEIIDHREWYLRSSKTDAESTLQGWVEREQKALRDGYRGLRLTGNTYWLEREDWDSFMSYERLVNGTFRHHRIIALCSYCFERCTSRDALDVISHHEFSLARHGERWQVVESTAMAMARQDLIRLQQAATRLRDNDRRKDEFMAILSHELRNPLSPIATASQVMRLRGAAETFDHELTTIDRQTRHLARLVDDLLDVSRITRGKVELRLEPVRVADAVMRAKDMTRPLFAKRGHSLSVDVPADLELDLDGDRFTQILANLLTNAGKYTQRGGEISVTCHASERAVQVTVSDNGPGVASDLQPVVFEPFVQGERSLARSEGGLGLGLPIVKSLTELHGGNVSLKSDAQGTAVTIHLPPLRAASSQPPSSKTLRRQGQGKVLVVDDNADAAELLAEALTACGYEVRVANDGQSALALVPTFTPRFAVLDIGLPDITGYELARALKQQLTHEPLTLIALTGYSSPSERDQARKAGFCHHLIKPAELHALIELLVEG